jgi:flavorubredoxin
MGPTLGEAMPDAPSSADEHQITNAKEHFMITTYKAAPDIDVLTTNFPIPGLGQLAINSFVLHGDVPVLVDTGPVVERESFMTALKSIIDPADLPWI